MIILNESKIKYEKLDQLLEAQLTDIRFSQQTNIIVDLKEIIKKFFRPDVLFNINKRMAKEEISSDIINIVGHYRNYFFKKGKYTSFYFLYSYDECEKMKNMNPEYKKSYYEKYFTSEENKEKSELIKSCMTVVEKIISILPNCMFINTSEHDELCYARYITTEITKSNELNIILSNDPMFYQLLNKNTFLLNLKGINSKLLTSDDCVSELSGRETELTAGSIPLLIALSGNKKYSISGLQGFGMKKSVDIIELLKERGILVDAQSLEFPITVSKLDLSNKLDKKIFDNVDKLTSTYSLIRGDKLYYTEKDILITKFTKVVRRGLREYLLDFNSKVFTTYPLNLDMIVKGESI